MKVFIHAFGCQMNKLDAELVLSELVRAGYTRCDAPQEADLILYNTCSVREHAEERVYSNVGKLKPLKDRRPDVVIGILGCMAQKDQKAIFRRLPHVDLVVGTREFARIVELVDEATGLVLQSIEPQSLNEPQRTSFDCTADQGKTVRIRVVDHADNGYLRVDDFRLQD